MPDPGADAPMMGYGGLWGENPQCLATRRAAGANGDTRASYWSWVVAQLEADAED